MASLDTMRKVLLQTPSLETLEALSDALGSRQEILQYKWTEQPENILTCIAFGPLERTQEIKEILDAHSVKLY